MSGEIVSVAVTTTGAAGSATGTGTLVTPSGWIEWLPQSDALTACVTVYAYVVRHQD